MFLSHSLFSFFLSGILITCLLDCWYYPMGPWISSNFNWDGCYVCTFLFSSAMFNQCALEPIQWIFHSIYFVISRKKIILGFSFTFYICLLFKFLNIFVIALLKSLYANLTIIAIYWPVSFPAYGSCFPASYCLVIFYWMLLDMVNVTQLSVWNLLSFFEDVEMRGKVG